MFPRSCVRRVPCLTFSNNSHVCAVPEGFLWAAAEARVAVVAGAPGVAGDPGPLQHTPLAPHRLRQQDGVVVAARPPVGRLQPVLELLLLELGHVDGVEDAPCGHLVREGNLIDVDHCRGGGRRWFVCGGRKFPPLRSEG